MLAEPNVVARHQNLLRDARPVHEGPVPRTEIPDEEAVFAPHDLRMVAGELTRRQEEVPVRMAPDREDILVEDCEAPPAIPIGVLESRHEHGSAPPASRPTGDERPPVKEAVMRGRTIIRRRGRPAKAVRP